MIAHQEDPGRIRAVVRPGSGAAGAGPRDSALPVGEAGRALLGTGAPWYESWLEHPDHDDPHWAPLQLHRRWSAPDPGAAARRLAGPVSRADAGAVRTSAQRGVPVAVTIGPWTHAQMMTKGAPRSSENRWTGWALIWRAPAGRHANRCGSTSTGTDGRTCDDWPPAMPEQVLYLRPAGHLGATRHRSGRARVDVHLRPRRSDAHGRRPAAVTAAATATTPGSPSAPTC